MNDRTSATAARFGISEQCAALQRDLLTLPGAVKVEFDLDGFYDHMEQVILLVKFDIPVVNENYYRDLRALRQGVIDTAARHGLTRIPDTIENYGEHLYFVFHHDKTWEHTTPRTSPEIEQHLDELYRLTQRENNGEALTENEKHRYIWLYNEIHRLGGNIPFGVEI